MFDPFLWVEGVFIFPQFPSFQSSPVFPLRYPVPLFFFSRSVSFLDTGVGQARAPPPQAFFGFFCVISWPIAFFTLCDHPVLLQYMTYVPRPIVAPPLLGFFSLTRSHFLIPRPQLPSRVPVPSGRRCFPHPSCPRQFIISPRLPPNSVIYTTNKSPCRPFAGGPLQFPLVSFTVLGTPSFVLFPPRPPGPAPRPPLWILISGSVLTPWAPAF